MLSLSWRLFYSISFVIIFNNAVCRGRDIFISVNGFNSEFCLQEIPDIIYCRTLDYAFSGTIGESDIAYHIGEGEFELPRGYSFTNVANVGFYGSSAEPTKLVCKEELCSSAGLAFVDTRNVVLENLEIIGCGMKRNSSSSIDGGKTRLPLKTALYFQHCSDVSLLNVSLDEYTGIGVTMYDTQGRVEIKDCSFIGSTSTVGSTSGGGLYVETTYCNDPSTCRPPIKHARYRVSSSVFKNNAAHVDMKNITYILPNKGRHVSFGRGGGLGVFFRDGAHNNTFVIEHCQFFNNSALWGGGAYFSFQDDASKNFIEINDSVFCDNQADVQPSHTPTIKEENKGSSLHVNFLTFNSKQQHGNRVIVDGCVFTERSQVMSVFEVATDSFVQTNASFAGFENVFQLVNSRINTPLSKCSALSIISVSGESSQLVNKLSNVTIKTTDRYLTTFADQNEGFRSLLYFQNIVVFFEVKIDLDSSKKGQGILAVDTHIVILPHSTVIISNNEAISGGGMALYNSFIELHPNTALVFSNNTALQKGGAIFSTFTPTRSPYIRLCFLHYHDIAAKPEEWENVSVSFIHNVAMWKGHVLFATSLRNCFWGKAYGPSRESTESKLKVFTSPRVFHYIPRRNSSNDMATGAASISYYPPSHMNKMNKITFIPGKLEDLSDKFRVSNDFNRSSRFSPFSVQLYQHNQKQLKLKEENRFTDTFEVELHGCPFDYCSGDNQKPILVLQSLEDYTVTYEVEIDMSCCPPGFLYREEEMTCECSSSANIIRTCQTRNFTATLSRGYWAGYFRDNNNNNSRSCHQIWGGKCPSGFCSYDPSTPLPLTNSVDDLDNMMCGGNNRTGILCGQCKLGYCNPINVCSAACINSTSAHDDWWQWILTETIPLTVFIVLIFLFDFNLLSGPLNSYLLFAQFIAVIYASERWEPFEKQFLGESDSPVYDNRSLSNFMISLYGVFTVSLFNMDFFSTLLKPFCFTTVFDLNALHLIGIKFAFKLYPLVIILIVLLGFQIHKKFPNCFRCCSCCQPLFRRFSWKSIVHALAAIFVLNYAGFLKWATAIFSPTDIMSFHDHSLQQYRVYYHGDWEFRDTPYLEVAIPVLLAVIIINLPMSLFLAMCYPVIPTLAEQVKDSRNRCLKWLRNTYIVKVFQRDWVHHTADLFQHPYKDGLYKCFAGFLLLFRIPLIVVIMVPTDYKYFICGVLLMAWLVVHYHCWPNTKRWVNIVDALIYADMVIISFMHSYKNTAVALVNDGDGDDRPNQQESFDKGLLFVELLPTFYLVGYILHFLVKLLWRCYKHRFIECRQTPDLQPTGEGGHSRFRPGILISSNSSEPKSRGDGYQEL